MTAGKIGWTLAQVTMLALAFRWWGWGAVVMVFVAFLVGAGRLIAENRADQR